MTRHHQKSGKQPGRNVQPPSNETKRNVKKPSIDTHRKAVPRPLQAVNKSHLDRPNDFGKAAWRAQKKPIDHIYIPVELVLQANGVDNERTYEAIARQHNVHIFHDKEHRRGHVSRDEKSLGLWGHADDVVQAKRALVSWIKESRTKKTHGMELTKLFSMTPAMRAQQEERWQQDVSRRTFQQTPPASMCFAAIGSYHWPVEICRAQDVLGPSLEALDPIRMTYSCYVSLDESGDIIQVFSQASHTNVDKALLAIRVAHAQTRARCLEPLRRYHILSRVTSPTDSQADSYTVKLQAYRQRCRKRDGEAVPDVTRRAPRIIRKDIPNLCGGLNNGEVGLSVIEQFQSDIMSVLQILQYYRGNVTLRLRLGVFLATRCKECGPEGWSLNEFQNMTKESQFRGIVTEELGHRDIEKNLPGIMHDQEDFIMPSDNMTAVLADTRPSFDATFDFADSSETMFRLHIAWQPITDDSNSTMHYERVSERWSRFDRSRTDPTPLIDISLVDLQTPCAWQIDLQSSNTVDHLSPELKCFAESITLHPCAPSKEAMWKMLEFKTNTRTHVLRSVTQRRVFGYDVSQADYSLELAQFQTLRYEKATTTAMEPRWSVALTRKSWDTMFSQNERLLVGRKVEWQDDERHWFPASHQQVAPDISHQGAAASLLNTMVTIERIIKIRSATTT